MTHVRKINEGRSLRIALTTKSHKCETIPEGDLKSYLGGVGYAARLLYEELSPGIDPFSPENKFIVSTGPLTSYQVPGGGSFEVCFKSPANNAWGEARSGGDFGPELKRAGYDRSLIGATRWNRWSRRTGMSIKVTKKEML